MKWILLSVILCACRSPDYIEAGTSVSDGEIDRGHGVTTEAYSLGFTVGWHAGRTGRAMENLAALDVSRAGELSIRDDGHDVIVQAPADAPEDDPEEPLSKALIGAISAAVLALLGAGGIGYRRLRRPTNEEPET